MEYGTTVSDDNEMSGIHITQQGTSQYIFLVQGKNRNLGRYICLEGSFQKETVLHSNIIESTSFVALAVKECNICNWLGRQ